MNGAASADGHVLTDQMDCRTRRDKIPWSNGTNMKVINPFNASKFKGQLAPSAGGLSSGNSSNEQTVRLAQRPNQYNSTFEQTPVTFCPSTNWTTPAAMSATHGHLLESHADIYPGNPS
ncbi:hypothetical protein FGIG_06777 [Fasciola gigantica]|uniref:Uncharacterized protein n=1 Tax=Fasciola gigantica TaxID=46835 RepID=A0A504YCD2_FASGI|nr:hypothetical protein FGIG_06777 [Fasciola gigantica]